MKTKKTEIKAEKVSIPMIDKRIINFDIRGVSSLIVHRFDEKARGQMLDIMNLKARNREMKNGTAEYERTIYYFQDGKRTGFPAIGFKKGMIRAAKQAGMAMTDARAMFHVLADEGTLVEIKGKHNMRDDMVRLQKGGSDIRFRAEYPEWSARIKIIYNGTCISSEQLANLLNIAGFASGIGDWRPEKDGFSGMYEVVIKK